MKTLSERILEYRAKHNLSQEDFANLAKLNVMTVNSVENGKRNTSKLTTRKIEMILMEDEKE